jgi:hypothetical protein
MAGGDHLVAEESHMATTPDRNPLLASLDPLAVEWTMTPSIGGQPLGRARTTFDWLDDSDLLIQKTWAESTEDAPPDDGARHRRGGRDLLDALLRRPRRLPDHDRRPRMAHVACRPGFHQRFHGTFSEDGSRIDAHWEGSQDGIDWQHDFDVTDTHSNA